MQKAPLGAFFMVSIFMIDTVTVVFKDELDSLHHQARSLDLYATNVGTIFITINEDSNLHQQIELSWWGRWQAHVKIVPRNYFENVWSNNGWVSQQALKLLTSAVSSNPWNIVLDAKTFFVKAIPSIQPCPCVGQLDIYPVFEPSRQIVNQLFDIDLQAQLGPGGVPFVINTDQVQQMISWIEQKVEKPFATWFQEQGRLTEFLLYSGWLQYNTGSLDRLYNVNHTDMIPCNLCHSEVGAFDRKFQEMQKATTVSIHRNAWSHLSTEQQAQYTNFLASRGIK
jgi:hypothetical protein